MNMSSVSAPPRIDSRLTSSDCVVRRANTSSNAVVWSPSPRNLDLHDLVLDVELVPVEPLHDQHRASDHERRDRGERVEAGSGRHPDRHGEEDEAHVPRLLDRVAEADDRKGADERERTGQVRPDNEHDHRDDHPHHHERLHVALAVRDAAVRRAVDEADDRAEPEREQHRDRHVRDREGAAEILEAGEEVV